MPDAVTRIANALLDLALLPAGRRVAELGLVQIVADHGDEAAVHRARLAAADLVYGGLHVVVDAPLRDALECLEGVVVRVEQHLVALLQVGAVEERPAVAQLEVGHL